MNIATLAKSFALKLATGKAYTHLYYIFIMMQFYLAFPFVLWLFQRFPFYQKYDWLPSRNYDGNAGVC
ncbi:peptidoglycan/LPS O-acetylase OafA/YrhL [Paenibacillus polymyxa]|nr:peptidoglycan/LPS O-acetylase OafA/YrhL [Paenibacillus polymyxa]